MNKFDIIYTWLDGEDRTDEGVEISSSWFKNIDIPHHIALSLSVGDLITWNYNGCKVSATISMKIYDAALNKMEYSLTT